jgi:hypothetical protein
VNDDHHGYHDSITHSFVAGVRHWPTSVFATPDLKRPP